MKKASISHTKNHLSALLDEVRHGESFLILDRNRPVARLEPVTGAGQGDAGAKLARLERGGILRRGRRSGRAERTLKSPPPRLLDEGSALEALLAERDEAR